MVYDLLAKLESGRNPMDRWEKDFNTRQIAEAPAYSLFTGARYLRIKYTTLCYWVHGRGPVSSLVTLAEQSPPTLSFLNLLECHVIGALLTRYSLKLPSVRNALETVERMGTSKHPLLTEEFKTDGIHLFLERADPNALINVSQGGQLAIKEIVQTYLERIVWKDGAPKLYPFVAKKQADEPKIISIAPTVAFGRSVIDGTAISTAVIASRFNARESMSSLAEEYGRQIEEIEEAIRWETGEPAAA
jgi:uncharacterized protein (DUF433 family)